MSSAQLIVGLTVLALLCITLTHSLKCYYCNDETSCKKPKLVKCDAMSANETSQYLDLHYEGVPQTTSWYYDCIREHHKSASGEFYYSGCINSHISGCFLDRKEEFISDCYQCSYYNGCNSVGRAELHIGVTLVAILLGIIGKGIWRT